MMTLHFALNFKVSSDPSSYIKRYHDGQFFFQLRVCLSLIQQISDPIMVSIFLFFFSHPWSLSFQSVDINFQQRPSATSVDIHVEQAKAAQSHLMKKIPANSEAAAILVVQDESIEASTLALVRMSQAQVFEGFLEVPIPVRFLCIFIGPIFSQHDFHEMGRAMGTLFSDEVWYIISP